MTSSPARRAGRVSSVLAMLLTGAACTGSVPTADAGPSAQPDNPGGALISDVQQDSRFHGAEPASPYVMPDVTLQATNDQPFNLVTDTAYAVTLVFFGYTNCPDVCGLVMSDLASAVLQLPGPVRAQTQVVFITTDPSRDTPPVLRDYLDRYDESFVGLTGDMTDIRFAAEDLGVAITGKHRLASGGYDVGHGAQVIGFVGDQAPVLWTEGTPVTDLVDDITEMSQ